LATIFDLHLANTPRCGPVNTWRVSGTLGHDYAALQFPLSAQDKIRSGVEPQTVHRDGEDIHPLGNQKDFVGVLLFYRGYEQIRNP